MTKTRLKGYSVDRIQSSPETMHREKQNSSETTTGKEKAKKVQASEGQSCCPYILKKTQADARYCQQIFRGVREVFGSK